MEKEEFLGILKTKKSAPFLFLGSGFTKHYLNTPKWDELLQHFSSKPLGQYSSTLGTEDLYVIGKQSLRAVLRTLIKIYTFAPNFKFGTK